jgi:hypothetical protein
MVVEDTSTAEASTQSERRSSKGSRMPRERAGEKEYRDRVTDEFAARRVATEVIAHLELRRAEIIGHEAIVRAEVEHALVPIRDAYRESGLPAPYFAALEKELREILPARWRAAATAFTSLEQRSFGSWRGGDVYARVVYVFVGLVVGSLCVAAPFIPIWEKWFPFAVAAGGWWLPDAQAAWHRRRYARRLGQLVQDVGSRQRALEAAVTLKELDSPR